MRSLTCMLVALLPAWGSGAAVTELGGLYPRESASRDVTSLNGLWDFRLSPRSDPKQGYEKKWYEQQLKKTGTVEPMYVPSSFNDMSTDVDTRDFVGTAWYDKTFYVPTTWKNHRVWLRFGGIDYQTEVWVNGKLAASHEFGQLPFRADITSYVHFGSKNLVTVAVVNTLTKSSIPQGTTSYYNTTEGRLLVQKYNFDYFHYAGIDRPVYLYTTPELFIDDITVKTGIKNCTGTVQYSVKYSSAKTSLDRASNAAVKVELLDKEGKEVASAAGAEGLMQVPHANLWWPQFMGSAPGYLYYLQVTVTENSTVTDTYTLPVGIRTITWNNKQLLINNKELYLRGFRRHEDSDFRGRGFDYSIATRDQLLLSWIAGNSYRTAHYPHAEEFMDMCDRMGVLIIDEVPFMSMSGWGGNLLTKHKSILSEMIARDKNRPSVIMWSIGDDLDTSSNGTEAHVKAVVEHVKTLDSSRPVMLAINKLVSVDKAAHLLDVIGLNLYYGWDLTYGRLDGITTNLEKQASSFHTKHNKPVLVTEYGADAYSGIHNVPEAMWSEDYQTTLLSQHFKAFDYLRKAGYLVGEMTTFADYKTHQERTRVDGNRMGMFTRQRQPKRSAHVLRQRYYALANILDNVSVPTDVKPYIAETSSHSFESKTEL